MEKIIKNLKKLKADKSGFSIIEMLVSLFIIAMISGLFLANMRSGERSSRIALSAQRLVSDIRTMQISALGAVDFNGEIPLGGWGIQFKTGSDNNKYILFANLNDIEDNSSFGPGEEYRTVQLPGNVVIEKLATSLGDLPEGDAANIVFLPPDPTIYINNSYNDTLFITLSDGQSKRVIETNFFGLVDIQN